MAVQTPSFAARKSGSLRFAGSGRPFHLATIILGLGLASFSSLGADTSLPLPKGVDHGEVLLGTLNCTACHAAEETVRVRVGARPGPVLGDAGLRLTPQWLRAWLGNHESTKPGSTMPDLLHGLSQDERAEAIERLTHYLASIQPAGEGEGVGADPARVRLGRELYHSAGCVACHAPQDAAEGAAPAAAMPEIGRGVSLAHLASKYPAGDLVRFLMNPVKHRPSGRMPGFGLSTPEATALATYLLREQAPGLAGATKSMRTIAGLRWEYFEGSFRSCKDMDGMTPVATGETTELSLAPAKREQNYGLRFTGVLEIPTEGEYTFWLKSDDGTTLVIDEKRVVDNDGEHGTSEKNGRIVLAAGPHTFELRFFQNGGGAEFDAEWAGPGLGRQKIPAALLKRFGEPLVPVGASAFAVDAAQVAKGRQWFARLQCAACHTGTDNQAAPSAAPLDRLADATQRGCLADIVPARAPKYALTTEERTALRTALARGAALRTPATPATEVAVTLARLNCLACHAREDVGGPAVTGRDPWFRVNGGADLGEEGRLPPHLSGVGAKLKREWLHTLLASGRKVRPYMATRMPVFGEENIGRLAERLEQADARPGAAAEPVVTPRDAKFGRKLVGREGLNCITCHTFTAYGSLGVPALGLENMHERLRWDWLRRYLPDPAALRPGTRMPTFWPEGKAVNTEVLGGDTDAQIHAIYAWMKDGPKADVPAGLVRSRQELAVDREAVIYRNFIEGAGSRAIGVGYPERANLAFDANELRLALIWQGAFIDTSRHSSDRGVGYEPPLGDHVVKLPSGPAFAVLGAPDAAWPKPAPHRAGQQFLGYSLDDVRRPTFRYAVGSVQVEDALLPKALDVDISLTRTLKLNGTTSGGQFWFRAAQGNLQRQADGSYLLEGKVRFRFRGAAGEPVLVNDELRVPVAVPGQLVEEITW